jgi:hypothetical protein
MNIDDDDQEWDVRTSFLLFCRGESPFGVGKATPLAEIKVAVVRVKLFIGFYPAKQYLHICGSLSELEGRASCSCRRDLIWT